jgi:pyruvate kinase
MAWGIKPLLIAMEHDTFELFDHALQAVKIAGYINEGDLAVMTAGVPLGITGNTNIIKVQTAGRID